MTKPIKPIQFRPNAVDDALITTIKAVAEIETNADLIRLALKHYAAFILQPEVYKQTILDAVEQDVKGL